MTLRLSAALALALFATPALAHDHDHGPAIAVEGGWTRETAPGQAAGGGFLHIENHSDRPDRLLGAASPVATSAQIHTMTMQGQVMQMRPLPGGLVIPPHGSVDLKPGSLHIMLIGLKHPLRAGESVPVMLRFAHAGAVPVRLAVQPVGAMGPMAAMPGHADHMDHMDMGHDHH